VNDLFTRRDGAYTPLERKTDLGAASVQSQPTPPPLPAYRRNLFLGELRNVPLHIRKGLLRLYGGISALWVLWLGSQIVIVLSEHPYGPVWRYISRLFWTLMFVPIGGPILFFIALWIFEGFRKNPQTKVHNLRDRIAIDILCRPDVAAYEFLATGSYLGRIKIEKIKLGQKYLSAEQEAILPFEFYGPNGVDPDELAPKFAFLSGKDMVDRVAQLFEKYGYLNRDQMLDKIIDEEVDRRLRKGAFWIRDRLPLKQPPNGS
jgi:hypothetical protein